MDYNEIFAIEQLLKIDDINYIVENLILVNKSSIQLIEALYAEQSKLKDGEVFIETLSMRISLTTHSIVELTKGYNVETTKKKGTIKLIDFPSINILCRSIIETFLTLEYLFYNKSSDDEKEFRVLIWRISGYKSRQGFFNKNDLEIINEDISKKLESEFDSIKALLIEAKKYKFYTDLKKNDLWKLDTFGIPRLKSWSELLELSILKNELFITPYKLYSNYAHSEFISLIQINGKDSLNQNSIENNIQIKNALRITLFINCVSIMQLINKFPNILPHYNQLTKDQKDIIEFWSQFSTD